MSKCEFEKIVHRLPTLLQYNEDCDQGGNNFNASEKVFQPCSSTMRIATILRTVALVLLGALPTLLQYNEDCDKVLNSYHALSREPLPTLLQYNEDCDPDGSHLYQYVTYLPTLLQYNEDCDYSRRECASFVH